MSRTERLTTPSYTIGTGISRLPLSVGVRPRVGLRPTSPQQAAGIRIEPPPSLACDIGTAPAATNAAEPADEAPEVCPVCHGLRTGSSSTNSALGLKPNSESRVLPSTVGADRRVHPREVAVLRGPARPRRPGCPAAWAGRRRRCCPSRSSAPRRRTRRAASPTPPRPRSNAVAGQPVQLAVDLLGAGDGGLDDLAPRHPAGADLRRQPDRVVLAQGVVTEGVDPRRAADGGSCSSAAMAGTVAGWLGGCHGPPAPR